MVISGDGLVGAVGGAMAGAETPLGIVPGGRGNDLARVLGIPDRSGGGDRGDRSPATAAAIDVGEANGKRFLGIVSVGFDSDANRLANEVTILRGNLVYVYAALRTLLAWKPARFTIAVGERADPHQRLLGLRRQQPAPLAAACSSRRTPSSTTASSTCHGRRGRQAALRG